MSVDFFSTTINTTIHKKILKLFDSGFISSGKKKTMNLKKNSKIFLI